jgi:uncharacterized protein (DUF1778 family)
MDRTQVIQIRVSPQEKKAIAKAAKKAGLSVAEFIRAQALKP